MGKSSKEGKNILIFDFDGGTFNVVVLKVFEEVPIWKVRALTIDWFSIFCKDCKRNTKLTYLVAKGPRESYSSVWRPSW